MTKEQEERLVIVWEGISKSIGDLHEAARTAISKQWPEAREPREAVISHLPTTEEKIKQQTGNTDGPVADWLAEFDPEEIGPREKEFLERQAKQSSRPKANTKASGSGPTGA